MVSNLSIPVPILFQMWANSQWIACRTSSEKLAGFDGKENMLFFNQLVLRFSVLYGIPIISYFLEYILLIKQCCIRLVSSGFQYFVKGH